MRLGNWAEYLINNANISVPLKIAIGTGQTQSDDLRRYRSTTNGSSELKYTGLY